MLDVEPQPWNVDAMWGPPWSPRWTQNDPFMLINRMHGLKIFVGSGNGLFGRYNYPQNTFDDLFKGTPLELLAFAQAKAFASDVAVDVASQLFALTGASGTDRRHDLDRHWRNIRTITLHNPVGYKARVVGQNLLHGTAIPANAYF